MREISKIENGSSLLKCVVLTSSVEDSSEWLLSDLYHYCPPPYLTTSKGGKGRRPVRDKAPYIPRSMTRRVDRGRSILGIKFEGPK